MEARSSMVYRSHLNRQSLTAGIIFLFYLPRGFDTDGMEVVRPYTPTTLVSDIGFLELVIKIYKEGKVSAYFGKMKEGEYLSARGPNIWPNGTNPIRSGPLACLQEELALLPCTRCHEQF